MYYKKSRYRLGYWPSDCYFVQDGVIVSPSTAQDQETETELEWKSTSSSWTPLLFFLVWKETFCAKELSRDGWWLSVTSHTGQAQDSLLDPIFRLGGEFTQLNKWPEVFSERGSLNSLNSCSYIIRKAKMRYINSIISSVKSGSHPHMSTAWSASNRNLRKQPCFK